MPAAHEQLVLFLTPTFVALAAVSAARHLLRNPLSRFYPDVLKHRWSMASMVILGLYVNFTAPFLLFGQAPQALAAFLLTTIVVLTIGKEFLLWIADDVQKHWREGRSLLEHRSHCVLHEYDRAKAKLFEPQRQVFTDIIFHAYEFVVARQSFRGHWQDFLLPAEGTSWTTALVGLSMNESKTVESVVARKAALAVRRDQRPDGGWGYRSEVTSDVDSTSFSLRFLAEGDRFPQRLKAAEQFLISHQDPETGGFRTYYPEDEIRQFMRWPAESFLGWCSPHICVTANAIQALLKCGHSPAEEVLRKAVDFIRKSQSNEGFWESYWWNGRIYSTSNCMRALLAAGEGPQLIRKAQGWLIRSQLPDGGWADGTIKTSIPIVTALAVRALLLIPSEEFLSNIERGINWLVARQLRDGSWQSFPVLRVPHPWTIEPWRVETWGDDFRRTGTLAADQNRLLTTSIVLAAICDYTALCLSRYLTRNHKAAETVRAN